MQNACTNIALVLSKESSASATVGQRRSNPIPQHYDGGRRGPNHQAGRKADTGFKGQTQPVLEARKHIHGQRTPRLGQDESLCRLQEVYVEG